MFSSHTSLLSESPCLQVGPLLEGSWAVLRLFCSHLSLFFGLEALSTCSPGSPRKGKDPRLNAPFTLQAEPPPRKSTWRQKHESFIRTLRHARQVQQVIARGGNPSDLPSILPAENPDYVQCPHCSRHFAPKVAERHIPKCKTIKNRPPPPRRHDS